MSVLLPEPDGPMIAVSWPSAMSMSTSRSARTAASLLSIGPGQTAGRDDRRHLAREGELQLFDARDRTSELPAGDLVHGLSSVW